MDSYENTSIDQLLPEISSSLDAEDGRVREVLTALRRVIRAVDLQSKRVVKASGLTTAQILILQAIRELGEVTTGRISEAVSLSQGTVTTILDRMEQRGLIERYRSTQDRRIVHTRMTEAGADALDSAPPLLHETFVNAFGDLEPEYQAKIITTLDEVAVLLGGGTLTAAPVLDLDRKDQRKAL